MPLESENPGFDARLRQVLKGMTEQVTNPQRD